MTGNITWQDVVVLITIAGAFGALWKQVSGSIGRVAGSVDRVAADLAAYKTDVANNYAKNSDMESVEKRMMARFDELIEEVRLLRVTLTPKRR